MATRVTLRQVAETAGVSIGTASAVFTEKDWVSEPVKASVVEAARVLGYQPRRRRAEAEPPVTDIGFVSWAGEAFSPANPYYARVLHGAQQACAGQGIALTYEVVDPGTGRLPLCVERGQVSGLLVLSYGSDREYLRRIIEAGVACVLLEHTPLDLPVDHVRHDDENGGYLATRHLLELDRPGPVPALITAPENIAPATWRLRGYRRALEEHGLRFDPQYVRYCDFDVPGGHQAMLGLLDLPVPPTSVFCANDESALGALDALRGRGLRVPQDVALVGYDDVPLAEHASPPLTTIAADKELIGAQAVWHLLERLRHPGVASRDTRLAVRLVRRGSTALGPADGDRP
ncbi:LacI family DNA-binding transcriptional regulator [Streptomyces longwoodensis]|uniref:LacI family DNA-binding transcriptional regulator n=1 Tax=Streptomyces longwoodensis TaxID=68231 RepID=UPI0033F87AF1